MTSERRRIDVVVFDIGNVLLNWNPRNLYREIFHNDTEAMELFLDEVCTMEWHIAHDRGVSFEENAKPLKARFPEHAELIDLWAERQLDMVSGAVDGAADLIRQLAWWDVPLYGLTNMPPGLLPAKIEQFPFLGHLREVVVSGDEGVMKPDHRIFEILVSRTGIEPKRAIYVDDRERNVDAANEVGFRAHHFTGTDRLRAELANAGLI